MREIKFRGQRLDNREWAFGSLIVISNLTYIVSDREALAFFPAFMGRPIIEVDPKTVGQFTGLTDKNGLTEIYEGDIIDADGQLKGNIYESPQVYEEGIDCIITEMGTRAWRGSESIAVGLGCSFS